MIGFLGRRLLGGFITLALFVTGLFFLVNLLIPGDWTSQFILDAGARAALQESLGIDRPLIEQYWTWISNVATLNLGTSFGGEQVWTAVRQAMATTIFVFISATLISFPLGFWMGRVGSWNERRWFTIPNTAVAVMLFTAFPPAIAFLVDRGITNVLSAQALRTITELDNGRWPETVRGPFQSRFQPPQDNVIGDPLTSPQVLWRMIAIALAVFAIVQLLAWTVRTVLGRRYPPAAIVATTLIGTAAGWRLSGFSAQAFDIASVMAILIGALVILSYGEILLVTEAAMFDTRDEDFILTARAKGLPERVVRDRHSARAALLPVLSRLVVSLPYFFTGLVILEFVFDVEGGLGNLIFQAINTQDTPLIVGSMAIIGVITLVLRLVLEASIAALDPRVRLADSEAP